MEIGIDASRANVGERTGTERYALNIIRGLVSLDRSIAFTLYLDKPALPELQNLGSNVRYRLLSWPPGYLWSQVRLSLEMLRHRPDVLFVPAHTMPVVHPKRTVVTLHDIGFERFPELYGRSQIGGRSALGTSLNLFTRLVTLGRFGNSELDYHRWSARFAVKHATKIITVSEFSKSEIVQYYHARGDKLPVVYHGIDRDAYRHPEPATIAERQRACRITLPYLLYVGRLEKKKNLLAIVRVFAEAKRTRPDLSLVLIGEPGLGWGEVQASIQQHGLSQSVRLLGWIPDDAYVPLLAGASALVMLSRYEGFGLTLLEAFAAQVPVVCSNAGSLPEIAGDAAMIVNPDDVRGAAKAVLDVINNPTLRTSLAKRGTRRVSAFTWERASRQTLALLLAAARS